MMACLLLSACNDKDIDGALRVFKNFVLLDEEGYRLSIAEGTYEAEFTYKTRDGNIELEIDDVVAGYDRDFLFNLPDLSNTVVSYDSETKTEQVRWRLPASATGQTLDAEVVISNRIISEKPPQIYLDRCQAYRGIKGGISGLLGFYKRNRDNDRTRSGGIVGQRIYSVASYTESYLSVAINLVDGEKTVAMFEGTERRQYRNLLWEGKCGEYDRPILRRN